MLVGGRGREDGGSQLPPPFTLGRARACQPSTRSSDNIPSTSRRVKGTVVLGRATRRRARFAPFLRFQPPPARRQRPFDRPVRKLDRARPALACHLSCLRALPETLSLASRQKLNRCLIVLPCSGRRADSRASAGLADGSPAPPRSLARRGHRKSMDAHDRPR